MDLPTLWFVIIAVFWTGFFVLEGFDLGVGALHHWLGRNETERRIAVNTIGPFWDGNEVWLIVGGAAIFAAFPSWYATWFSAGYLALVLVLLALIVRGLSFEWRGKGESLRWKATWSWTLTIGSALIPLLLGVALGDLLAGLPINATEEFTGSFFNLLTPYGLALGATLLVLCLLHGATFVTLRTGPGWVHDRAEAFARRLVWPGLILALLMGLATALLSVGPGWAKLVGVVPVLGLAAAVVALRSGHEGRAFAGTAVGIGGLVATLFANLYPTVMVSTIDGAYSLTVSSTASGQYALQVMTIVALVLFPVVLLYQGWTYWVFRARLRGESPAAGIGVDAGTTTSTTPH